MMSNVEKRWGLVGVVRSFGQNALERNLGSSLGTLV
jgi:hypothetical protein